jgi:hypothetical protein
MPLTFLWNSLYSTKPNERETVECRINTHYVRMGLEDRGAVYADVACIPMYHLTCPQH